MTTCIILGGADTLQDDTARYSGPIDGCVACNDAGAEWPGDLNAWVSLHPRYWIEKNWKARRAERGYPEALSFYAHESAKEPVPADTIRTTYLFPGQDKTGSSGLFAAKVALIDLGFDEVVLCGVPMTSSPHFFGGEPWKSSSVNGFRKQWLDIPILYRARMRSMSGWTRQILGGYDA